MDYIQVINVLDANFQSAPWWRWPGKRLVPMWACGACVHCQHFALSLMQLMRVIPSLRNTSVARWDPTTPMVGLPRPLRWWRHLLEGQSHSSTDCRVHLRPLLLPMERSQNSSMTRLCPSQVCTLHSTFMIPVVTWVTLWSLTPFFHNLFAII